MLIRASGFIHPGFAVLAIGQSYTYAIVSGTGRIALFDPGLPSQLDLLISKLGECGIALSKVTDLFITHLHPERIGSVPWIRTQAPTVSVWSSPENKRMLDSEEARAGLVAEYETFCHELPQSEAAVKYALPSTRFTKLLQIDHPCTESETINLGNSVSIRGISTPGHTASSISYLVNPYQYLIVDEGFGYFNGRNFATPGGDWSISETAKSILKTKDLALSALCFPNTGMITGHLVGKHLTEVLQNSDDLIREAVAALKSGTAADTIFRAIESSFYTREAADPVLQRSLKRSLNGVCHQIQTLIQPEV